MSVAKARPLKPLATHEEIDHAGGHHSTTHQHDDHHGIRCKRQALEILTSKAGDERQRHEDGAQQGLALHYFIGPL